MKYDLLHLPGPPINGCGKTYVNPLDLADDHERGDRIKVVCSRCGRFGTHEVRGALRGLA